MEVNTMALDATIDGVTWNEPPSNEVVAHNGSSGLFIAVMSDLREA